ncbi:hypothetical protein DSUL_30060 [Desulfovibrionales bacterium]
MTESRHTFLRQILSEADTTFNLRYALLPRIQKNIIVKQNVLTDDRDLHYYQSKIFLYSFLEQHIRLKKNLIIQSIPKPSDQKKLFIFFAFETSIPASVFF